MLENRHPVLCEVVLMVLDEMLLRLVRKVWCYYMSISGRMRHWSYMGKLQWGNSQSNASVEETSETETSVRDGDTGALLKHNSSESEKGKMIFDSWESIEGYYNASFEGESQCFSRVLGQSDKCKKDFIFWRWTFPALCTISPYNHTSMRGAVLFFHDFVEVQKKYSPNAPADTMRDEEP